MQAHMIQDVLRFNHHNNLEMMQQQQSNLVEMIALVKPFVEQETAIFQTYFTSDAFKTLGFKEKMMVMKKIPPYMKTLLALYQSQAIAGAQS
jgi:hypothetical protein